MDDQLLRLRIASVFFLEQKFHNGDLGKWLESRLETQVIESICSCGWLMPVSNFSPFVETHANYLVVGLNLQLDTIGGQQKILRILYTPVVRK